LKYVAAVKWGTREQKDNTQNAVAPLLGILNCNGVDGGMVYIGVRVHGGVKRDVRYSNGAGLRLEHVVTQAGKGLSKGTRTHLTNKRQLDMVASVGGSAALGNH
jgi:hypothetical protein